MEFEFDPEKSHANKSKHGIDFVAAQMLWGDSALLEIPARTTDEPLLQSWKCCESLTLGARSIHTPSKVISDREKFWQEILLSRGKKGLKRN